MPTMLAELPRRASFHSRPSSSVRLPIVFVVADDEHERRLPAPFTARTS
jgi:hypothetical protein